MARFYGANVVSAFVHLHDQTIAYRDLKPENLLIDAQGYLKIADFGFAKKVADRTFTLCGTPEYLAPEIISNAGHACHVDWWAFGVLLYEMLIGTPPFVDDDPITLYKMILRGKFVFPEDVEVGEHAQDIIGGLVVLNPATRLGCLRKGSRQIATHPFFKALDLKLLPKRTIRAPYVPPLESDRDLAHFRDVSGASGSDQNPAWMAPVTKEEQQLFVCF
uniref:non-specific serine/threonine protein kinase n=1 Tax=Haptolina brevifila TaxID=156173 RepID=A0A7S2B9G2_9EUKA